MTGQLRPLSEPFVLADAASPTDTSASLSTSLARTARPCRHELTSIAAHGPTTSPHHHPLQISAQLAPNFLRQPTYNAAPMTSTNQPPSSPPSAGNAGFDSSEPNTPHSTGYAPTSSPYSPAMATALLPGAPITVDLLILTEYLTSQFKQAGNNGHLASQAEKISMQDFLIQGNYGREDMEAGFLYAVSIVVKARTAYHAAVAEVAASKSADTEADAEVGEEAKGFRAGFGSGVMVWEDVSAETASGSQMVHLQRGVLQAYGSVAELKVAMLQVFKQHGDEKMEVDGEDEEDNEDASSVEVETGSLDGKDGDRMEVDSAYEA